MACGSGRSPRHWEWEFYVVGFFAVVWLLPNLARPNQGHAKILAIVLGRSYVPHLAANSRRDTQEILLGRPIGSQRSEHTQSTQWYCIGYTATLTVVRLKNAFFHKSEHFLKMHMFFKLVNNLLTHEQNLKYWTFFWKCEQFLNISSKLRTKFWKVTFLIFEHLLKIVNKFGNFRHFLKARTTIWNSEQFLKKSEHFFLQFSNIFLKR